jgi:O-glycosyl hydrolase
MKKITMYLLTFLLMTQVVTGCKKDDKETEKTPDPNKELTKVTITVDKTTKHQTIEGFGFFGAYDVWWGSPNNMWNDAWGEKVISDLGIIIWRNELFPPAIPGANQDADWNKQKPVVQGLKAKADQLGVDLKYIVTVWSPPADMKWQCTFSWAGDANATRSEGTVSTKNGGTLNPNKYTEYAEYWKTCLKNHKDLGIDVYAISLQNEPMFKQTFNSCTYTTAWYCELLNNVVPKIKETYPNVKIFGSEHMLEMEGKSNNYPYFYHQAIKNSTTAKNNIDVLAVHGYSDGVNASSGSELSKMWTNHTEQFSTPMNKPAWMTETSGYSDNWLKSGDVPGALNLAMDMYSGLSYGNIQAWVWWQGSETAGIGNYNLMNGNTTGKKYAVSKHYYRYIRPGAVRVKASTPDPTILVTAYEHTGKGTQTLVIINSGAEGKMISVQGAGIPAEFTVFRTNSATENCKEIGKALTGAENYFEIPANSIVTLQAGGTAL